jgi:hypothetical protein
VLTAGKRSPALGSASAQRSGLIVHLVVLAAALLVLIAAAGLARAVDVSGSFLTREPQVALDGPSYAGAASNLGALVWMLAVVMAFVGWVSSTDIAARHMFRAGTFIGSVLLVDDFFLVHDVVSARVGAADELMSAAYFAAVVALLIVYREALGPLARAGIVASLLLLGLSSGIDVLSNDIDQFIEDGIKFLGICTWATAWTLRARPWDLRPRASPTPPPGRANSRVRHPDVDPASHPGG